MHLTLEDSMAKNLKSQYWNFQTKENDDVCDPAFCPENTKDDGASPAVTQQEWESLPANTLYARGLFLLFLDPRFIQAI